MMTFKRHAVASANYNGKLCVYYYDDAPAHLTCNEKEKFCIFFFHFSLICECASAKLFAFFFHARDDLRMDCGG